MKAEAFCPRTTTVTEKATTLADNEYEDFEEFPPPPELESGLVEDEAFVDPANPVPRPAVDEISTR